MAVTVLRVVPVDQMRAVLVQTAVRRILLVRTHTGLLSIQFLAQALLVLAQPEFQPTAAVVEEERVDLRRQLTNTSYTISLQPLAE
jgi:hypothetical protein